LTQSVLGPRDWVTDKWARSAPVPARRGMGHNRSHDRDPAPGAGPAAAEGPDRAGDRTPPRGGHRRRPGVTSRTGPCSRSSTAPACGCQELGRLVAVGPGLGHRVGAGAGKRIEGTARPARSLPPPRPSTTGWWRPAGAGSNPAGGPARRCRGRVPERPGGRLTRQGSGGCSRNGPGRPGSKTWSTPTCCATPAPPTCWPTGRHPGRPGALGQRVDRHHPDLHEGVARAPPGGL